MYSTCLFCAHQLGHNDVIEPFPVGRRLAFDAAKGRLWVICRHCERWNLSPLEQRWEAVQDCERRFRAARKRVTSDNIGLARIDGGLELVRIGAPLWPEFAAWRYGDQFGRRRSRAIVRGVAVVGAAGTVLAGGVVVGTLAAASYWIYEAVDQAMKRMKDRRVVAYVPTEEGDPITVLGEHLPGIRLKVDPNANGGWKLELPHVDGRAAISGGHALHAAGLIMPSINGVGGTPQKVDRAIKRLETFAHPAQYLHSVAAQCSHASHIGRPGSLVGLPADVRLAIEMAANEENERFALEGEMWLLELAWEEAEEIAAIADNMLLSMEVQQRYDELRRRHEELRRKRGRGQ
jgi:hypothetical protein